MAKILIVDDEPRIRSMPGSPVRRPGTALPR